MIARMNSLIVGSVAAAWICLFPSGSAIAQDSSGDEAKSDTKAGTEHIPYFSTDKKVRIDLPKSWKVSARPTGVVGDEFKTYDAIALDVEIPGLSSLTRCLRFTTERFHSAAQGSLPAAG